MNANELVDNILTALELSSGTITDINKQELGMSFVNEIIAAEKDGDEPDFLETLTVLEYAE